jgi:ABC-type transport system involved in cytochrome bd biosynthesis fused ATPase/permease subunit
MEGLKGKTVLLVTHQVDFLPAFDSILVITNYIHLKETIMSLYILLSLFEFCTYDIV